MEVAVNEKISTPNLGEADELFADLFQEVRIWEEERAGGTQLGLEATTVDSLFKTKITFGNPKDNLIRLTRKRFENVGIELTPIRAQQMRSEYNFYYMTVTVNMRPQPGTQFKMLCCQLNLGPKGPDEPIVQSIFPQNQWRTVMNWGGGLNLGLNGNLEWEMGVDASKAAEITKLPGALQAHVGNKNEMKSFIVVPDYNYEVGRFDIAAYGEGTSECYWYIQEPDLQTMTTVQFGMVFKVPKTTDTVTLHGVAWAEPDMNWLVANLRNVRNFLKEKFVTLLKRRNEVSKQFARGAAEEWTLTLPE